MFFLFAIYLDTLHENIKKENELTKYVNKMSRYESQIALLKSELADQKQILAPAVMLSNIVKKVSSQLGTSDVNQSQESLDESMRKVMC